MTDTKLAEDLFCLADTGPRGSSTLKDRQAAYLRLRAAIEHLERGAVALRSLIAAVPIRHMGGEQNVLLVHQWDEADTARRNK